MVYFFFEVQKKTATWFITTVLVISIITTSLVSWAGIRGGVIRHTEIRGELEFLAPITTESDSHEGTESQPAHSEESGHSHE